MKSEHNGHCLVERSADRSCRWKVLLSTLALGTLLCGCATHYDITLRNGDVLRAPSKPKLNERGYYVFKDANGEPVEINKMRVRQIEPVRAGSLPSSPFNNTK